MFGLDKFSFAQKNETKKTSDIPPESSSETEEDLNYRILIANLDSEQIAQKVKLIECGVTSISNITDPAEILSFDTLVTSAKKDLQSEISTDSILLELNIDSEEVLLSELTEYYKKFVHTSKKVCELQEQGYPSKIILDKLQPIVEKMAQNTFEKFENQQLKSLSANGLDTPTAQKYFNWRMNIFTENTSMQLIKKSSKVTLSAKTFVTQRYLKQFDAYYTTKTMTEAIYTSDDIEKQIENLENDL